MSNKRLLTVVQVDTITGEIYYNVTKIVDYQNKSHKVAFLRLCEKFFDSHFTGVRNCQSLQLTFPDTSKDEELPIPF